MQQIKNFEDYLKYLEQKKLQEKFIDKDEQYGENEYVRFDRVKYNLLSKKVQIPIEKIDSVSVENRFDKIQKEFYGFQEQSWVFIRTNPNVYKLDLNRNTIEDGIYLETQIQDILSEQKIK